MKKQTKAIHFDYQQPDPYGALSMPVYNALAYEFDNSAVMADSFCGRNDLPDYSRVTNPTVTYFERKVREITGARDVIAFNSGMAAITAVLMGVCRSGSEIVTSRHLFGNTYLLMVKTLGRLGVKTTFLDLLDTEAVEMAVSRENVSCLFLEIMTNPQMEIADIRKLADAAHRHGVSVIADTTMIPFTEFNAGGLGVDIEIVSSTKYISGGGTSLGGLVIDYGGVDGFDTLMRRELLLNLGSYMTPQVAYMMNLGLENLNARYRLQSANAMAVASRLAEDKRIRVCYPGLADNPFHQICRDSFGGSYGAMLTFELPDEQSCYRFMDSLKLVKRATNLFDNRSLAIHPASTIFGPLTAEERKAMDVSDCLIRLSVGLEDPDDVVEDIFAAIDVALA